MNTYFTGVGFLRGDGLPLSYLSLGGTGGFGIVASCCPRDLKQEQDDEIKAKSCLLRNNWVIVATRVSSPEEKTLTLAVKPEAVKQQGVVKRMCKCIKIGEKYQ